MNTDPDEIISVKATTGNHTGDVVKGCTCRTLNVTRKIFIRDIERIIRMSLKMTQFSIGTSVYEQIRGSPMGSPLSPALCMMVVALSEEIWYRTYTTPPCQLWISLLAYFAMWTTDFAWRIHPGTMTSPSLTFCTRSSTAIQSSWKRSQIRSSWAFVSSSNPLHYATAPHATSTRSWHHFRHHLWLCNYLDSCPDFSWSPNARTPAPNDLEVLPHCIVCTELQVFRNPI